MILKIKSFYFLNLGCPKNQVDGDHLRGVLNSQGLRESLKPETADYIIINTCAFIEQARLETRGEIAELLPSKKSGAKLIAVGCYPVLRDIKKEIPELDAAFAFNKQSDFLKYITNNKDICWNDNNAPRLISDLPYAYVKISDGCNNRCSYCSIPDIRGPYISISPESIICEVKALAENDVKEIILVAQDTTVYGSDLGYKYDLANLANEISRIKSVEWIRIMYAHPAHFEAQLLNRLFTIDKVCRYIDMPLQHISDRILNSMNRKTDGKNIRSVIKQLRNFDNNVSLRTTLMVGFPGESDDDFKELLDFVEEVEFDYLGAFCYSPEEGTKAKSLIEQIDPDLAAERYELLIEIAERHSLEKARLQIGKKQRLLIEGTSSEDVNFVEARSQRQAPGIDGFYKIRKQKGLKPGMFVEATITDLNQGVL
jgi:ribosomal protein S12 methylthiotransferase